MGTIPLTQGFVALVDEEDVYFLSQWKWHVFKEQYTNYAARGVRQGGRVKTILMHRLLLTAPQGKQVDHRDHNGLNNTRANLRLCTQNENQHNRRKNSHSLSQYKGVTWWERLHKWRGEIRLNGKWMYLGYFDNEEDAARAYDKAASLLFGEFARLNKVKGT